MIAATAYPATANAIALGLKSAGRPGQGMLARLNLARNNQLMRTFLRLACLLLCSLRVFALQPVPLIYSTDLLHPHDDPDDHFDLACLYAIPEADLRAIILDQGDRQSTRPGFRPVWQLNHLSGCHVPAAVGLCSPLKNPQDTGMDQPAEYQNGVNLILQTLRDSSEKVAIMFVGSARDVVAAYNRRPGLFHQKVRSVHGFIGDSGDPRHREYNVGLDPQAFIGLMQSDVLFYWIPCFDGGAWTNNGHASFWQARHGDLLAGAPPPLQQFFLYMLRQDTNDPITSLSRPVSPEDRAWLMSGQRNLWCGALLGLALGRPLLHDGNAVVRFSPVRVAVDGQAGVHYTNAPASRVIMRFEITHPAHFAENATRATRELLESFPVRFPAPNRN